MAYSSGIYMPFENKPITMLEFQKEYLICEEKIPYDIDGITDFINKYWKLEKSENVFKLKDMYAEDHVAYINGYGNRFIMDVYYKIGRKFADNEYIIIPKPFENEPITIRMFKRKYKYFAETFDGTTAESFMNVYWKPYSSDNYGIVYGFIDVDRLKLVKEILTNYEEEYGEKISAPGLTKTQQCIYLERGW